MCSYLFRVHFPGARKWRVIRRNKKGIFIKRKRKPIFFKLRRGLFKFTKKFRKAGKRFLRKYYLRRKYRRGRRVIRRKRRRRIRKRRRRRNRRILRRIRRLNRIRRLQRRIRLARLRRRRRFNRLRGRRIVRRTALLYQGRYTVYFNLVHFYYYSIVSKNKRIIFKIHGTTVKRQIRRHLWRRISLSKFM